MVGAVLEKLYGLARGHFPVREPATEALDVVLFAGFIGWGLYLFSTLE
jgi:hypothetical protein